MMVTTKVVHGMIITILNYGHYQNSKNYEGHNEGQVEGHNEGTILTRKDKERKNPDFFSFKKRYSDQKLIERVFAAIATTRKHGKVKNSILLAQLQKWERYSVEQVEAGIRIYLEKDCAGDGKREDYLLGIIRKQPKGIKPNYQQPLISPKQQPSIEELLSNE